LKNDIINILRSRNHQLITDNAELQALFVHMENEKREQERYINYLETLLNELGWNPNREHTC
jgi:hypothetical protein